MGAKRVILMAQGAVELCSPAGMAAS